MSKETEAIGHDVHQLADDARALLVATADIAGDQVAEARKRLAAALDRAQAASKCVKERTMEGVKAADATVRAHPYQAIGIAVGIGALLGFFVCGRYSQNKN